MIVHLAAKRLDDLRGATGVESLAGEMRAEFNRRMPEHYGLVEAVDFEELTIE